jgi:hypothetical protein
MIRIRFLFLSVVITALGAFSLGFYCGYFGARNIFVGHELEYWAQNMALQAAAVVNPTISGDFHATDVIRRMSRALESQDIPFPRISGDLWGSESASGDARRASP